MAEISTKNRKMSLRDYDIIAQKILFKYYPKLICNVDALNCVIETLIASDIKYNASIGTLYGFRLSQVKYALKTFFKKMKTKRKHISLDDSTNNKNFSRSNHQIISKKNQKPVGFQLEYDELINYINSTQLLLDIEKRAILSYYIDSESEQNIANELKVSQPYIHMSIKRGLEKLKWKFQND